MADLSLADPRQQMIQALMQPQVPSPEFNPEKYIGEKLLGNPNFKFSGPTQLPFQQHNQQTPPGGGMLSAQPPGMMKDQSRFTGHPFPPPPNMGQPILPQGF